VLLVGFIIGRSNSRLLWTLKNTRVKKKRKFIGYVRDQQLLKDSAQYSLHQWLPTDAPQAFVACATRHKSRRKIVKLKEWSIKDNKTDNGVLCIQEEQIYKRQSLFTEVFLSCGDIIYKARSTHINLSSSSWYLHQEFVIFMLYDYFCTIFGSV